ncbi:MAG: LysR family transcriptional regulator [Thermoanaerobaculia bacterium]|mgnify:CR=1 FL=1
MSEEPGVPSLEIRPRLRVYRGEEIALGPGKAALLAAIGETGTLHAAASQLGMSYMRAWKLVRTMNRCFDPPLVVTRRGGPEHGRASLSPAGEAVLELYRRMEAQCQASVGPLAEELRCWLATGPT